MAEYIERRTAIEHLNVWCGGCGSAVECILAEPAADVAPVVHGRWIEDHDYLKRPECGVMVKWDFTFSILEIGITAPTAGRRCRRWSE